MSRAFADACVLTYRGHDFVRQWVERCDAPSADLACIRFYWETNWQVVGGKRTSGGALLYTDARGLPVRYELLSPEASLRRAEFRPDGARITLRDGSTHLLALPEPPALVFQSNVVLMLSTALSQRIGGTGEVRASCFLPDALRSRPVVLVEQPARHWNCDLGLSFDVDEEYRVVGVTTRDPEVSGRSLGEPFPSEAFSALDAPQPPRYSPPPDRRFELVEATIPGPVPLGATVCLPSAAPPSGGVLFLKGSGRQDRHGFVDGIDTGAHGICDFLADRGLVTLRFDARGAGRTPFGNPFQPMLAAREEDARAALAYLAARPEVDPSRIVLIGHSLGAITAMRIASDPSVPAVRALVLLAPPGRPLEAVMTEQALREARRLEMSSDEQRRRQDLIPHTLDREAAQAPERDAHIDTYSYAGAMRALRDDFRSDPAADIRRVGVPVLLCYGDKDLQVDAVRDGARLLAAARESNVACELRTYGSLDHLFRRISTEPSPADYFESLPVDLEFLGDLRAWLGALT